MVFRRFRAAAIAAAQAADDKKAEDVLLLDVKKTSGVADYFVLATVDSTPQLSAVADNVDRRLREEFQLHPLHSDGRRSTHWMAIDYGALVVHIFRREAREFYSLDRLWEKTRLIRW
jgi:ribosome-associated protein